MANIDTYNANPYNYGYNYNQIPPGQASFNPPTTQKYIRPSTQRTTSHYDGDPFNYGYHNHHNHHYNPPPPVSFSPPTTQKYIRPSTPRTTSYYDTTKSTPVVDRSRETPLQCGITKRNMFTSLIINGKSAGRNDFPWLVAHFYLGLGFICGRSKKLPL